MKSALIRWWLTIWVIIAATAVGSYYGMFQYLWNIDSLHIGFGISSLIMFIFVVTSGWIGYLHYQIPYTYGLDIHLRKLTDTLDPCWFAAESMTALGLTGTVVGFLMMLGTSFAALEIGNIESMQQAVIDMGSGMSTALITTLVGLVCSLLMKKQLVNLEHGIKSIQ